MPNTDWSRSEVEAVVDDYRQMLIQQFYGQAVNKAEHNRRLRERLQDRSKGSVEFKHANISAVLDAMGFPTFLKGYLPRGNFQALLQEVLEDRVFGDAEFARAASHVADQPAIAPAGIDFSHWIELPPAPRTSSTRADYRARSPVDFVAVEARNRALGLAGEELALAYERERLERAGKGTYAGQVEHVSRTRGDGLGYDILSFETDGRERFVEVKTTAFAKASPFYISRNELAFSEENADRYRLYRLFEFRDSPRMFEVAGSMRQRLVLNAVTYQATVGA